VLRCGEKKKLMESTEKLNEVGEEIVKDINLYKYGLGQNI
jgi:hypothetical protein